MKKKQTSNKDINHMKIIRNYAPDDSSLSIVSLQIVFSSWLEESTNTEKETLRKEVKK